MKKLIISCLLGMAPVFVAHSQTVVNDSTIILTIEEARTLAKMTEDLKCTKSELEICDSIQVHKDNIIALKDSMLLKKDEIIKDYKTTAKKRAKKIGLWSGGISLVIGLIIGGLAF